MDIEDPKIAVAKWEELVYEAYSLSQEIREIEREISMFTHGLPVRRNVPIFPDPEKCREYRDLKRLKSERIEEKVQIALELVTTWDMPVAQGWIDLDGKLIWRLMGSTHSPTIQVEAMNS
jgi:hypothetical protein